MLKALQKALGGNAADAKLSAEDVTAAVQAAVAELRTEFDEYKQTAEALLENAEAVLVARTAELDAALARVKELEASTVDAEAAAAAAEAEALARKLAARKEKVVAAIGTERADALLKVTEGMDDAAFEAVASALGVSAAAEADSPLFKEVGADAQADASKVEESAEMKILKAKYEKK